MCAAFEEILKEFPTARLLLVGDFESGDPIPERVAQQIRQHPQIALPGFVSDVAPYYPLMDIYVLPSSREGFPSSPMEAAACKVPTIGFHATGTIDAVVDGETGIIVPCGDDRALAEAITRYLSEPELRREHGVAARDRVRKDFAQEPMWEAMFDKYVELLRERGLPVPKAQPEEENSTVAVL